jgi:predicted RecA/RadA family phage recombinase
MKNYIQPGNTLTIPAPAGGVVSGQPVVVGSLRGFAAASAAEGDDVAIVRRGVFEGVKETGAAWAVGDKVYLKADGSAFNKTATSNTLFGFAAAAAASGDAVGQIVLGDTI